jgi:hypothetical protein
LIGPDTAARSAVRERLDLEPLRAFYHWQMSRVEAYRTTVSVPRVIAKVLRANDFSRQCGASAGSICRRQSTVW